MEIDRSFFRDKALSEQLVFVDGISFIPIKGAHTQKIPPKTSVKESKVRSAAGRCFEPIE